MMNRAERRRASKANKKTLQKPTYNLSLEEIAQIKMSPTVQTAVDKEINRQLLEKDKKFCLDYDAMVIWALHKYLGFGKKRAEEFYFNLFHEHYAMRQMYEMASSYPAITALKAKDIDVESWYDALFDENGDFKDPSEVVMP